MPEEEEDFEEPEGADPAPDPPALAALVLDRSEESTSHIAPWTSASRFGFLFSDDAGVEGELGTDPEAAGVPELPAVPLPPLLALPVLNALVLNKL